MFLEPVLCTNGDKSRPTVQDRISITGAGHTSTDLAQNISCAILCQSCVPWQVKVHTYVRRCIYAMIYCHFVYAAHACMHIAVTYVTISLSLSLPFSCTTIYSPFHTNFFCHLFIFAWLTLFFIL